MSSWGFYGRSEELDRLRVILARGRWFFLKIAGRRRIGKTTLIRRVLPQDRSVLYFQVPDSGPAGVLSAAADAFETFNVPSDIPPPKSLRELAHAIGHLARRGYVVALDEFQYFTRKPLSEFTSHLQFAVDELSHQTPQTGGGLIVLGSIHTEMAALLEDRRAPLYNRVTDELELGHLDIAALIELLEAHANADPQRLLFLWNLFEGVPKFYRDCFEQDVLGAERRLLLQRMFFQSSAPLRAEADNWFLHELRGHYDVFLKYIARHPGCTNADLKAHVAQVSPDNVTQAGGYVQVLREKYRMVERRSPIFEKKGSKKGRYYIRDNFLRSWLSALKAPVDALDFRPVDELVGRADERLMSAEGFALERLVATLYEERSRKRVGDFGVTRRIEGYWDRGDTELDVIALNDDERVARIVNCKRSPDELVRSIDAYDNHIARFMKHSGKQLENWKIERVAVAPVLAVAHREALRKRGYVAQDLHDLVEGL